MGHGELVQLAHWPTFHLMVPFCFYAGSYKTEVLNFIIFLHLLPVLCCLKKKKKILSFSLDLFFKYHYRSRFFKNFIECIIIHCCHHSFGCLSSFCYYLWWNHIRWHELGWEKQNNSGLLKGTRYAHIREGIPVHWDCEPHRNRGILMNIQN